MPEPWPSLADQIPLSEALFGAQGPGRLADWVAGELARTTDTEFARSFSDHIDLPGVVRDDYLHRVIRTPHGNLLGGIRFYGRDITRPFVEIIAHSFADLDHLRDCVTGEWSVFGPSALRLLTLPHQLSGPHVRLDKTIHVGRCRDIRSPAAKVVLTPFDRVQDAIALVRARYRDMPAELARNVTAATDDDLRGWHAQRQLHAIHAHQDVVGVLAVAPGSLGWIDGDEINEEVVASQHRGHGFAADAQAYWAAQLAPNPDELFIGTIDGLNAVSRKTAEAAGRRRVLDRIFVSLDGR